MTAPSAPRQAQTAAMLVIGDEILSGRTRDANAPYLAERLNEKGLRLSEIRVISDDAAAITAAVTALSERYDHVFTSGGIGPTHDDITADAVAAAFGRAIDVRADARAILEAYYGGDGLNEARLRMARIPEGATLIDNPVSRAPGFRIENVHVMAGVPIIFQEMVKSVLAGVAGGPPQLSWSLRAPVPEGDIAEALGALAAAHQKVSIGVYPFYRGGLGATIVLRGVDRDTLGSAAAAVRALLATRTTDIAEAPPAV